MAMWSSYAWAVNYNVALLSLINIEDDLLPYCNGQFIHPTNPPINRLPIRKTGLDGIERGSGGIPHVWLFGLPVAAIQYLMTTYFTVAALPVASRQMTLYTLSHEQGVFKRFNANVYRPLPGQDYSYDVIDQLTVDLRLRMLLVAELA